MAEFHEVVVIGGGQAGLVASHALDERGIDHVVLERHRVAERWRSARWDSLRFQFPSSALALPGLPYDGPDPDGYAHHREVVTWLERYAALVDPPLREHTEVTSLDRDGSGWRVTTDHGPIRARAVVVATGPFQQPRVPSVSADLPRDVVQIHAVEYRRPELLPDGAVLVVGSGASGAQITEDLLAAGRRTYLCVSRHRRVPRRFLGRDVFTWLVAVGLMDRTRADWVDGRMPPAVLVTGAGGGHDLDVRSLGQQGSTLLGTLQGVSGDEVHLDGNAEAVLAAADAMCEETLGAISRYAATQGIDVALPERPAAAPPVQHVPTISLRAAGITSVVWATGYRYDHAWVHAACIGSAGEPRQHRGVTEAEGLYFLGLHWMHTFKSGTFLGIGDDAAYVVDHLLGHVLRR